MSDSRESFIGRISWSAFAIKILENTSAAFTVAVAIILTIVLV